MFHFWSVKQTNCKEEYRPKYAGNKNGERWYRCLVKYLLSCKQINRSAVMVVRIDKTNSHFNKDLLIKLNRELAILFTSQCSLLSSLGTYDYVIHRFRWSRYLALTSTVTSSPMKTCNYEEEVVKFPWRLAGNSLCCSLWKVILLFYGIY